VKPIRVRLLVAGLAVLLATAIARSQSTETAPPAGPPMHGPGAMMGEHMLSYFTKALNLTEDQQTQAKTILNNSKSTFKALMQRQREIDQQLHSQAEGSFDAKQVQMLASQKALIQSRLTIAETELHHQLYQLLTTDQQTQLKQLEAEREARMQQRRQQDAATVPPAQ
jgi:Spy/CpxP family protein refolding chaperone